MTVIALPQSLPWAETPGLSATITNGLVYTTYDIRVRDTALNLVGEVQDFSKCTIIKKFNGVGQCTLLLNANDPMAPYLATPGYGIVITRTISNSSNVVVSQDTSFFSGNVWEYTRANQAGQKTLQVIAYDDLLKVATRDAYPVVNYPYRPTILGESNLVRYYRMDELPSIMPLFDLSPSVQNGTYVNSPTTASGGIDEIDSCVTFNGTNQYATSPSTALPTGNGSWTVECWFNLTTFSGFPVLLMLGAPGSKTQAQLVVNPSNQAYVDVGGGNTAGFGTVSPGAWYHVAATWDGATLQHYVNGVAGSSITPGALNLSAASAGIAANVSALTNFCNGSIDEVAIYTTALSAARIQLHYAIGLSRFAAAPNDTSTGNAESVIQHFVNVNAGPGAVNNRQQPFLQMGTNNNNGSTVTGVGTFDKLLASDGTGLLQRIALASTPNLGFKVTQSGQQLTFACYVPTDQTSNCIFSDDLGNLGDFSYEVKGPDWEAGGNALVVGGSGTGTARNYYMITDSGSVTSWGRVEQFIDQSNTTDLATLASAAAAAIVALRSTSSLTLQLTPQAGLVYGVDFNLGDKVTYVIDGAALQDIVREVQIDLDPSNGEVVTPAVGSPNTAALMHAYAAYVQQTQAQIAALRNRVANVERRQ